MNLLRQATQRASLAEVCSAAALDAHPDDAAVWIDAIRQVRDIAELRRA